MIVLTQVDSENNVARWYCVTVQPTLLDGIAVVCLWSSRRTGYQRQRVIPATSMTEAQELAEKITERKIRRGYQWLDGL